MKCALYALSGLLSLGLLIYLVGCFLPAEHVAEGRREVAAPLAAVAQRVREVEAQPRWRRGVKAIEIVSRTDSELIYREQGGHGPIRYRFREIVAERQFESRIDDDTLPFGGRWIIELSTNSRGTEVRIREEGVVRAPVFRTLSRFVFGHETTLRGYLEDLAQSFGTEPGL